MIRLLRGQVVIRELARPRGIWIPDPKKHDVRLHRGVVLAVGAPALCYGHEVAPGFGIGDTVLYHWIHLEKAWTREWEDGKLACWIPQECVDMVIDPGVEVGL